MKNLLLFGLAILIGKGAMAQPQSFTASIQNQSVSGSNFSFEIWLKNTSTGGQDFYLAPGTFVFTFDNTNFTSPGVSAVEYIACTNYGASASISNGSEIWLQLTHSGVSANNLSTDAENISTSGNGTRIATITVTGISNASGYMGLDWYDGTAIFAYEDNSPEYTAHDIMSNGTFINPDNTPLPVNLVSFEVSAYMQKSAVLTWVTASEENNKGFYIERSTDGRAWSTISFIGTKADYGNSNSIMRYGYTDENVMELNASRSIFYYRLRQQDYNGTAEYVGGVKTVRFATGNAGFMLLSPNPVNNYFNITTVNGGLLKAVVTDVTGRQVYSAFFEGSTKVNTASLRSGIYMVTMKNASGEVLGMERIVVNR